METPQQIEQRFAEAGWCIDNGFPGYLVIGYSGDTLSYWPEGKNYSKEARIILSSRSSTTRATLPTGLGRYPRLGRPLGCSESTASHPRSGTKRPRRRNVRIRLGTVLGVHLLLS